MKSKLALLGLLAALFAANTHANPLFSLENLERERAALLKTFVDENVTLHQRQQKVSSIYRRLADIERMVLRDERISSNDSQLAKNAFDHYELTFLVHASAENQQQPLAHWLTELNLSTDSILNTTAGLK